MALNERGKQFFPCTIEKGRYSVHQHHKREVKTAAKDFFALSDDFQTFINRSNTILTMQGHPEKNEVVAKLRVADAPRWLGFDPADTVRISEIEKSMELEHDGRNIWRRVVSWVHQS